jgi:hypothetical protein
MSAQGSHHTKTITGSDTPDLTLTGTYIELTFERLLFNRSVVDRYTPSSEAHYMIARFLYHNRWDYRISIHEGATDPRLIDTEGLQHERADVNAYLLIDAVTAINAEHSQRQFLKPPSELEGHSKARGWTWFDSLPLSRSVWPHRLLMRFSIFDPGHIGGLVRDTETFEFIFSPEIFSRSNDLLPRLLLPDERLLEQT